MTGFNLLIFSVRSNRSTNCATTTALACQILANLVLERFTSKEGFAALARDRVEVVAEGFVAAHGALLG